MARVTNLVRTTQNARATYDRLQRALKRERSFTEVPFEWHSRQTKRAVLFPTYGWVPQEAIRWRRPNGLMLDWTSGREGDALLIASEFVQ